MSDLFTLADARTARDDALHRVVSNSGPWLHRARVLISRLRKWEGTAEELRFKLIREEGLEPPHHHNAWGGLTNSAIRSGLLKPCNPPRYVSMTGKKSHARKTQVLRSRDCQ